MHNRENVPEFKSYLGNSLLKRSGVPVQWTSELIQEFVKCKEDPVYFAEHYIKIVHVDRGLIDFIMYDYQKDIIRSVHTNRNTIACTARQAGKTVTIIVGILHYMLFNANKQVALLANKGETAREILGRLQLAYYHLPAWLQQGVVEWNKGSFELENGSKVIAAATSNDAIRGRPVAFLYIDECAFIENWEDFSTSVLPTISSGEETKIVYCSTPKGLNHYFKTFDDAQKGKNDFNAFYVPWNRVPGRGEEWKRKTLADMNGDLEKFSQEYECQFLGSSGTLIAGWKLKELVDETPTVTHRDGGRLLQYIAPVKGRRYAMTVDVSRGKGLDFSSTQVIDVTEMPYQQVCVFHSNLITPTDFAATVFQLVRAYNDACVLVEINDIGGQVVDILHDEYEVENLVYTQNAGSRGKRVSGGYAQTSEKGIRTTLLTKNIGCSLLKLLIEQNQLIIRDKGTIDELKRFSRDGQTWKAEEGCHDDLVMCLVLFAWLSAERWFKDYTDLNTMAKLRDQTEEQITEELSPFFVVDEAQIMADQEQAWPAPSLTNWPFG